MDFLPPNRHPEVLPLIAKYSAGIVGSWLCTYYATGRMTIYDTKEGTIIAKPTLSQRIEATDTLWSLPFYPFLTALALKGAWDLHHTFDDRWHKTTDASTMFQALYIARMVVHCPIQCVALRKNPMFLAQMSAHHLMSIVCYCLSISFQRMSFFACYDGCCEVTTCFLNFVFGFKTFCRKDDSEYSLVKKTIGVSLWGSFIVFRLCLFPHWLWRFYQDVQTQHTAESWARITTSERYLFPGVTAILLGLSVMWFVPITNGFIKALSGGGKSEKKKD